MIDFKGKTVYWADYPGDGTVEDEYTSIIKPQHEDAGLEIENVECVAVPPLVGARNERHYDLLLFDWGGMSVGNSCLQHFVRAILKESEERPNRYYVMVSAFTSYAMKDAYVEMCNSHNVFLGFESFVEHLNALEKK